MKLTIIISCSKCFPIDTRLLYLGYMILYIYMIYVYTNVVGHEMERFICEKINRNILIQLGYLTND